MIYSWPSGIIPPEQSTFSLKYNTQDFTSPLTGSVQTLELPGARWEAVLTWGILIESEMREIKSLLAKLRGKSGRLYLWDMAFPTPRGIASGSPIVSGAGQTGMSLLTSGWSNSVNNILRPGDYIEVNKELKIITEPVNSNGSGVATLNFEPALRASPPNLSVINTNKASCTFRLRDDNQDQFVVRSPVLGSITLSFVETF